MPLQIVATDTTPGAILTFSATGLPTGLSINSNSGLITGTPSATGTFNTVITVSDQFGSSGSTGFTWTIVPVTGNTVTVTNPGSQTGVVGLAASLQMAATDSQSGQTFTWSATGLPTGTSISASGLITGTFTTAGTYNVTVEAIDTTGAFGTATFTWTITASTVIQARVGMSIPNSAFTTSGYYAFGRTQNQAEATSVGVLGRPRTGTAPLSVKKFWFNNNKLTSPSIGYGPGDYHLSNSYNNMANYANENTRVVACIRPYWIRANEKDSNGTPCNYKTSSQLTSSQKALAVAEYQSIVSWLNALSQSPYSFPSTRLRIVLWQEPANGQNSMLSSDYNNMIRTYGPAINSSVAADGKAYPLIINVNFVGGGPVSNATDYANAALGRQGHTATGVTFFGIALDYYSNSYFRLSGSPPWTNKRFIDDTDSNNESISGIADTLGLAFGLHEFGTVPKQVDPGGAPWTFGTQYFNYLTTFMSARVSAGKPNLDCIYYDGQGPPDGTGDITSPIGQDPTTGPLISSNPVNTYQDFRVPLYQAFFDAINGN